VFVFLTAIPAVVRATRVVVVIVIRFATRSRLLLCYTRAFILIQVGAIGTFAVTSTLTLVGIQLVVIGAFFVTDTLTFVWVQLEI